MPCCNAKRPMVYLSGGGAGINPSRSGIAGYISRYGDEQVAVTAPAWGGTGNFGKMVGAGVTIWAITKVLDRVFLRGGR